MDTFKLGYLQLTNREALIVGDPCYFKTGDGCQRIDLGWEGGNYPVFLSTEEGLPVALILSRHDYAPTDAAWQLGDAAPLAFLGVDSGQMALIAGHVLPGWSEIEQVDFNSPACDYDWAAIATLQSQLGANFLGSRLKKVGDPYPSAQIGTAVASRTRYGDGQYPLYVTKTAGTITSVAVVFHWSEMSDDDEWNEADFGDFSIDDEPEPLDI